MERTNLSRLEELGTKPVGLLLALVVHAALSFPDSIGNMDYSGFGRECWPISMLARSIAEVE